MKNWEEVIGHKWRAKTSHAFLLYLNVADCVLAGKGNKLETLAEHLVSETAVGQAQFIAFFNRGSGITFVASEMEREFLDFLNRLHPKEENPRGVLASQIFQAKRRELEYAFDLFGEMLELSLSDERLAEIFGAERGKRQASPFFAVVLEYVETIAPVNSAIEREDDRNALVTLLVWAKSRKISEARNLLVMVGEKIDSVAEELRSETNGITPVKIEFPDLEGRERTIEAVRKDRKPKPGDLNTENLAHLSAGMTRSVLRNLIMETRLIGNIITADTVFAWKKKFIEEKSGGLLEIMQPLWGLEAIGGLEEHKKYILEVVAAMKGKDPLAVPMGVLLLGAPGTGKTVFAQAMAHEAGIPFVMLKNIREMWVGKSERNLSFALELIAAQAPVVVFVDEIDQQFQSRSEMWDNTGVNNRIQGQLFQFMSETDLRGKVLWIAASNRPDRLDPALRRPGRFDDKIPFFPPTAQERGEILLAILAKMKIQAERVKAAFEWRLGKEAIEEFGWLTHRHLSSEGKLVPCDPDIHPRGKEQDNEIAFTGAQIEEIARKAYALARDVGKTLNRGNLLRALEGYVPGPDFILNDAMTEMALAYCSSFRFIPEGKWRRRQGSLRPSRREQDSKTSRLVQ